MATFKKKQAEMAKLINSNISDHLKVVGKCLVAEMMNKQKAILFHPFGYLLEKILIVLHMLHQGQN